ncbi:autotransporter-associated beta strand repeat-containing protein [Kiritimatiellaeota bacterium B1221]|nr:autotransporter-associated beta strand repeat-containing protein [Kiritimatiellaeota bacterium B1221]
MIYLAKFLFVCVLVLSPNAFSQIVVAGDVNPSPATQPIWTVGGNLLVGDIGIGGLEINDSGEVNAIGVVAAYFGGSVGSIQLNGGLLRTGQLSEGNGSGIVIFDGGILQLTGNQAALFSGFEAGDVILEAGGGTIDTQAFAVSSGIELGGTGSLTKIGSGVLTLSAANTYSGGTTVREGTLTVTHSSGLGSGDVTTETGTLKIMNGITFQNTIHNNELGFSEFHDTTSAGNANITNRDGGIRFEDTSSAGSAVILNNRLNLSSGDSFAHFFDNSTAGNAHITNNGGLTSFEGSSTAGNATIINNSAGFIYFLGNASAGNARITNNSGGSTIIRGTNNNLENAKFTNNAGGMVHIALHTGDVTIGEVFGAGNINLGGNNLTLGGLNTSGTISGVIYDDGLAGSLTKSGTGVLTLSGENTYTGGTTLSQGTLQIGDGGTTGSINGNVTNNSTLIFNRSDDLTFGGVISGTGTLTKQGAGVLTLSGVNTYAGGTTLEEGSLSVGSNENLGENSGQLVFDGGTLQTTGTFSMDRATTINAGGATFKVDSGTTLTSNGSLSGSGMLTKTGEGTLKIDTVSSSLHSGGTLISQGTLHHSRSTINRAGNITNHATLEFNVGSLGASSNYYDVISGTGRFVKSGLGSVRLYNANTYSGGTIISEGTLELSDGGALVGDVINNGSLSFSQNYNHIFAGTISGNGDVAKWSSNTLTLTGDNTYTGGTTVAGGTLSLGTNTAAGTGTITTTGSAIDYAHGISVANPITINWGSTQLQVLSGHATQSGVISEAGGARLLEKIGAGTLTLSAANTYTGGTTLSAGSLVIGHNNALGTGDLTIGTGTTIEGDNAWRITNDMLAQGDFSVAPRNTLPGLSALELDGNLDLGASTRTITNTLDFNVFEFGQVNFGGVISGDAGTGLTLADMGAAPGTNAVFFRFDGSAANTYSGLTTLGSNVSLALAKSAGVTALSGNAVLGTESVIVVENDEQIEDNANLLFEGTGRLQVGTGTDVTETVGSLSDDGSGNANISLADNAGGSTLRVGSGNFTGIIEEGVAGGVSVEKYGTDSLTLSGENTYLGNTLVSGGTLLVNNAAGSATGSGDVQVLNGATLGGSGFITGEVTIENGAHLTAGNSAGTLTTGDLLLNDNSQLDFELDTPGVVGGGINDLIVVNGDLQLDGVLNLSDLGSFGVGVYRLFNYTGTLTDNGLLFGVLPGVYDLTVETGTANEINLSVMTASEQYWDGVNTTPDGTVNGGSGIWDGSRTNWTNTAGNANASWAGGLDAVFGGTAGTVTIADGFSADAAHLDFQVGGYELEASGSGGISLSAQTGITTAPGTTTISAPISGAGSLAKYGAGVLVLEDANSYTGGTHLNEGELVIGDDNALGTGTLTIEDGTILSTPQPSGFFPIAGTTDLANDIVVNGDFSVRPEGKVIVLSSFSLNGDIDLSGGIRTITNLTAAGPLHLNGVISNGGITLEKDAGNNSAYFQFGGSAANTYTGDSTVGEGVSLSLSKNDDTTAIVGDLFIENDATVQTLNDEQIADDSLVHLEGNATFRVGLLGNQTETIGILSDDGSGNGSVALNGFLNGSSLRVQEGDFSGVISGGGYWTTSLEKYGNGLLTLSGTNTYRGGTLISGGRLRISDDANLGDTAGDLTFDGGALQTTANVTTDRDTYLNGQGGILNTRNGSVLRHEGMIDGTGELSKRGNGVLLLSGTNTYTGRTEVLNGQIAITEGGSIDIRSNIVIAPDAADNGSFWVSGAGGGGMAKTSEALVVGRAGFAEIFVDEGGTVEANGVFLGRRDSGFGYLLIDGAGSMLTATAGGSFDGEISIGHRGEGLMEIEDGGNVTAEVVTVGTTTRGVGELLVRNSGSTLLVEDELIIADRGFGDLFVRDEAVVTSGTAVIGAQTDADGLAVLNNGTWVVEDSSMIIGQEGVGVLALRDSGRLDQSGVAGPVVLGSLAGGEGEIVIGGRGATARAAGILDVSEITTGAGSGTLRLNHDGAISLTRDNTDVGASIQLSGGLKVQNQSGFTAFVADNSYTGGTEISGGALQVETSSGLGSGPLDLSGGSLVLNTRVGIDGDITWSGGNMVNTLGTFTTGLDTNGDLLMLGGGEFTLLSGLGFQNKVEYLLIDAGSSITAASTDFSGNNLFSLAPEFRVRDDKLFVIYPGALVLSGSILQNSNPVNIPVYADFVVNGQVMTGDPTESNEVRSLKFNSGSSLQVYNNLLVSDGVFDVSNDTGTVSGGHLLTPDDFLKTGGGALVVDSGVTVGGDTRINGGGLVLLGEMNTGDVYLNGDRFEIIGTVNAQGAVHLNQGSTIVNGQLAANSGVNLNGGRLGGTGQIQGNLRNIGGTVAPGNSIGTLNVNGNYTQSAGGRLEVEYASASALDQLMVSGTAILNGTLRLIKTGSGVAYGDSARFLSAQGGIQGQFSNIRGLPDGFRARQWRSGNGTNLNLLFAPSSYTLVAQGVNQISVATALDEWLKSSNPEYTAATFELDQLRAAEYAGVFESMLPSLYPALTERGLNDAYHDGRSVISQAVSARWMPRPEADSDRQGWRLWTDLRGGYSNNNVFSMDEQGGVLLVGMDQQLGEDAVLGFYLGGQDIESDTGGNQVSYDGEGVRYGVYGSLGVAEAGYVSVVAGGGQTDYDSKRVLPFEQSTTASPEASDWFTRVEAGWKFDLGVSLTPFVGWQYSESTLDAITEEGDSVFALSVEDSERVRNEGYAGFELAKAIAYNDSPSILRPFVRVLIRSDFSDAPDAMAARLDQGSSASFDYQPQTAETDGLEAGTGIRWIHPESGWGLNVGYTGFFGDDHDNHMVNMGVSYGR